MRMLGGLLAVLAVLGATVAAAPKDKNKRGDLIWTYAAYDSLGIRSIAFLPAAAYDNSFKSEKAVEAQLSAALRNTGYRWISPLVTKDLIKSMLGDSGLAAIDRAILASGRLDSLSAPRVCRALRVTAVLSARVDLFEQVQVEWNQSGKPSTTVQVRAAIVDSAGRLAWSAAGSETGEGPYHDPNAGTVGVKGSSLTTEPITGQGGAPSFEEVSTRLFTRWAGHFPAMKTAQPTADAPK